MGSDTMIGHRALLIATVIACLIGGGSGARLMREIGTQNGNDQNWNQTGNDTTTEGPEEENKRFQVAVFDFEYVQTNLMIALWVLFASIAKIAFHSVGKLENLFPESCLLIIIGVLLGVILFFAVPDHGYQLNVHTFFLILLPPIILDAGYFMPSRAFFDNLGTILLYAVVGTLLNTLWIGFSLWGVDQGGGFQLDQSLNLLHCLVFASLLAAVDPVAVLAVFESIHVNEMLHITVFGESLLNDGISVVLYHMFEGFSEIGQENIIAIDIVAGIGSFFVIVIGAPGIGIVCGLFAGFVSRFTRKSRIMEPLLVAVVGYMSFLLAEMFHLSGILSCTFCGITMRKYVEVNISQKSQTTIKYLLKMAASVGETVIFMYLGISAVSDQHHWNTGFVLLTLVFCLIFRVLGVILQTYFANRVRLVRFNKIDQFIMAYGGLRGAIAFALSVLLNEDLIPQKRLFVTTTIVIVYFTNLIMGTTVRPLVSFLKVKKDDKRQLCMNEKLSLRLMDHLMAGIEDLSGQKGHHLLRERFSHFNNKYVKPIIVGRKAQSHKRGYEICNVYKTLSVKDARAMVKDPTSATSVTRMQTHLKRISSTPEFRPDPSLLDISNWHRLSDFGSNPSLGPLSPAEQIPNGFYQYHEHHKSNGMPNTNVPFPDDSGYMHGSVDLSFIPDRPRHQIYRRHMLSSVSIPRLSQVYDSVDMTPSPNADNDRKRVTFEKDRDSHYYSSAGTSNSRGISAEDGAITFHVGRDKLPCCDDAYSNKEKTDANSNTGYVNSGYYVDEDGTKFMNGGAGFEVLPDRDLDKKEQEDSDSTSTVESCQL